MSLSINRRQMLGSTACAIGYHLGSLRPAQAALANDKLHIASVGVGGKGWSDMHETSVGQDVVAICDVDETTLAKAAGAFPQATKYVDWRKLLEQTNIDAVTVSTPDHMHAPIAMSAILSGRHVYCQKPLCHSVSEARQLTLAAARSGVVTQMGIQHHSGYRFRTAHKVVQSGAIGKVREAHVWTDRPGRFWPQDIARPTQHDAVPAHLHWDLWLGVAPERPYAAGAYHPFRWRGFWDFGTGALGDMGCHGLDPVASSLELSAPQFVWNDAVPHNDETGPSACILHYDFPGTPYTTARFGLHWYDGVTATPSSLLAPSGPLAGDDYANWTNGILFVGTEGQLLVSYEEDSRLLPVDKFRDRKIDPEADVNHYLQWTEACKGHGQTSTPFSYAGPLTEFVLLGNVALRSGQRIEWDSASLCAKNCPAADHYLRRDYRSGWEVSGLS